jgi:hypothetical protein
MDWAERSERLDDLIEAAGGRAVSGYSVGDEIVAWVIEGPRELVLAERDGRVRLLAGVGVEGAGVYPEDDRADEPTSSCRPITGLSGTTTSNGPSSLET